MGRPSARQCAAIVSRIIIRQILERRARSRVAATEGRPHQAPQSVGESPQPSSSSWSAKQSSANAKSPALLPRWNGRDERHEPGAWFWSSGLFFESSVWLWQQCWHCWRRIQRVRRRQRKNGKEKQPKACGSFMSARRYFLRRRDGLLAVERSPLHAGLFCFRRI